MLLKHLCRCERKEIQHNDICSIIIGLLIRANFEQFSGEFCVLQAFGRSILGWTPFPDSANDSLLAAAGIDITEGKIRRLCQKVDASIE
jgi:hypothetical protein